MATERLPRGGVLGLLAVVVLGLATAGSGPAGDGGFSVWLLYLGIGGAALLAFGGAAQFARSRVGR